MWHLPEDKFHKSQVSTVPNKSFPERAFSLAPGTLSKIHLSLVALK
jgi:hypothetical protein